MVKDKKPETETPVPEQVSLSDAIQLIVDALDLKDRGHQTAKNYLLAAKETLS